MVLQIAHFNYSLTLPETCKLPHHIHSHLNIFINFKTFHNYSSIPIFSQRLFPSPHSLFFQLIRRSDFHCPLTHSCRDYHYICTCMERAPKNIKLLFFFSMQVYFYDLTTTSKPVISGVLKNAVNISNSSASFVYVQKATIEMHGNYTCKIKSEISCNELSAKLIVINGMLLHALLLPGLVLSI